MQPECALESALKQSAFLQTDTPIKTCSVRGPAVPSPSAEPSEAKVACVSPLAFYISPSERPKQAPFSSETHTLPGKVYSGSSAAALVFSDRYFLLDSLRL